jgi:hypothetical protein
MGAAEDLIAGINSIASKLESNKVVLQSIDTELKHLRNLNYDLKGVGSGSIIEAVTSISHSVYSDQEGSSDVHTLATLGFESKQALAGLVEIGKRIAHLMSVNQDLDEDPEETVEDPE